MKKILVLLATLTILFTSALVIFAEDEGIDIQTNIVVKDDKTITISVPDSLASNNTTASIPCELEKPIVKYNGSEVQSTFKDGVVEFTADKEGTYDIVENSGTKLLTVSATSPALATGQGNYTPGEDVTVKTINNVLGYKFKGWYLCDEDGKPAGSVISNLQTYTFKMPDYDYNLIAVYESEALYTLTITGTSFRVNGSKKEGTYVGGFPAGSDVTVNYIGSTPLAYWSSGSKSVSTSNEYTFTIVGATSLEAVTAGELYKYIYVSAYNQILMMDSYDDEEIPEPTIYSPKPPIKAGGAFTGWKIDNFEGIYDGNEIGTKIKEYINTGSASKIIYIRPVYEQISGDSTLTVEYEGITRNKEVNNYTKEGLVTVVAPQTGTNFLYWKLNDDIISYSTTCPVYMQPGDNITVKAVYGNQTIERIPVVYFDRAYTDDGHSLLTSIYVHSVPDGYTIIDQGALYTKEMSLKDESLLVLNSGNSSIIDARGTKKEPFDFYVLTKKNLTGKGNEPVITRGYVIVQDSKGNTITYYSPVYVNTVNDLIGE